MMTRYVLACRPSHNDISNSNQVSDRQTDGVNRLGMPDLAGRLGFWCTAIPPVYREWWGGRGNLARGECPVWFRGRQLWLKWGLNVIVVSRASTESVCDCTTCQILKQMAFSNTRPLDHFCQLGTDAWGSSWPKTREDWKNVSWSDESWFLWQLSDGRVSIWNKQHERSQSSLSVLVQASSGGLMGSGIYARPTIGPIKSSWTSFKCSSLPKYCCGPRPFLCLIATFRAG